MRAFLKNMATSPLSPFLPLLSFFYATGRSNIALSLVVALIAVPLIIQRTVIFWLGYGASKVIGITYEEAAPASMIGASNHFEVAIATAVTLFGLESGAALSTVVGVLIGVPVMLLLISFCLRTKHWFPSMQKF